MQHANNIHHSTRIIITSTVSLSPAHLSLSLIALITYCKNIFIIKIQNTVLKCQFVASRTHYCCKHALALIKITHVMTWPRHDAENRERSGTCLQYALFTKKASVTSILKHHFHFMPSSRGSKGKVVDLW